jgi:hypothetical protein
MALRRWNGGKTYGVVALFAFVLPAAAWSGGCSNSSVGSPTPNEGMGVGGQSSGTASSGGGGNGSTASSATTLRGTVTQTNGSPIVGATLLWSPAGGFDAGTTVTTTTDSMGNFQLSATVGPGVTTAVLTATSQGFAPQILTIPLKTGVTTYTVPVTQPALASYTLKASGSTTVTVQVPGPGDVNHPATITVPAGAAPGTVMRVAPTSIGNSPGTMRAAGGPVGDALASLGMFYIDFVDATGNPIAAPTGVTVAMGAQTPPTIPASDPFNSWMLDSEGNWANPVPMTAPAASSAAPPAPIPTFGYWNSDHAFRTACITGTLTSPSGTCGGAHLDLTGPDGIHSTDSSGADGSFCLVGPQGHTGTLSGSGTMVSFPAQAGNCSVPSSCTNVGSFMVSGSECQATGGGYVDAGTEQCNSMVNAGGESSETIAVNMGKTSGTFDFQWNMYTVPDQMIVYYQGQKLFDTGCVSGTGSMSLTYGGSSQQITVDVNADCTQQGSTSWQFQVGCP